MEFQDGLEGKKNDQERMKNDYENYGFFFFFFFSFFFFFFLRKRVIKYSESDKQPNDPEDMDNYETAIMTRIR